MLAGQTARNSAKIISIGNRYIFFISVCFRLKCSLSTVFHCESQTKHSPLFSCITSTKNIKMFLRSISTVSTYLHYLHYLHLPRLRADPSAGRAAAQQEGGRHQRGLRHQMRQGLQVSLTLRRLRGAYQLSIILSIVYFQLQGLQHGLQPQRVPVRHHQLRGQPVQPPPQHRHRFLRGHLSAG